MALDVSMDDLIGSMQHGFHAGDRGRDLQQLRDGLAFSLAPHALGPAQDPYHTAAANGHAQPFAIVRSANASGSDPSGAAYGLVMAGGSSASPSSPYAASGHGRIAGSSASRFTGAGSSRPIPTTSSRGHQHQLGTSFTSSSGGSDGSYSSAGAAAAAAMGSHAPANTPMATPVDHVAGSHWPRSTATSQTTTSSQQQQQQQFSIEAEEFRRRAQAAVAGGPAGTRTPVQQHFGGGHHYHSHSGSGAALFGSSHGPPPNSPAQLVSFRDEVAMEWPQA
ncbi:hypothetical protein OC845_001357 [Tilletia horrida]|nr:hypothetical protein OC845_001357 [Tilletia horrida]